MLEQGPQEIRTSLPSRNPGLEKKRERGTLPGSLEAVGLPPCKRQADRQPSWLRPPHWLELLRWTRDCCVLQQERTRLGEKSGAPGPRAPSWPIMGGGSRW